MFEHSGIHESVVYEIQNFDANTCLLSNSTGDMYYHTTVQCLKGAPRIIYNYERLGSAFTTQRLVIKNCFIYWKDISAIIWSSPYIIELTLDDFRDEFVTGEIEYFHKCLPFYCPNFLSGGLDIFDRPVRVQLFSSVPRTLSDVFRNCTFRNVHELFIKG